MLYVSLKIYFLMVEINILYFTRNSALIQTIKEKFLLNKDTVRLQVTVLKQSVPGPARLGGKRGTASGPPENRGK